MSRPAFHTLRSCRRPLVSSTRHSWAPRFLSMKPAMLAFAAYSHIKIFLSPCIVQE